MKIEVNQKIYVIVKTEGRPKEELPDRLFEEAAALAVYLHGLAGDLCRDRLGEYGMLPGDLAEEIPAAILRLQGKTSRRNRTIPQERISQERIPQE